MININQKAISFNLPDQDGKLHKLSDYVGRWVLLYFYPKDNTPGCTKEVCSVAEAFIDFSKINAIALGVSADSAESHKKFAEKYNLKFPLLSDESKETIKEYGVWGKKKFLGKEFFGIKRTSFLINPEQIVVKIYENVKPAEHIKEVIFDLKNK